MEKITAFFISQAMMKSTIFTMKFFFYLKYQAHVLRNDLIFRCYKGLPSCTSMDIFTVIWSQKTCCAWVPTSSKLPTLGWRARSVRDRPTRTTCRHDSIGRRRYCYEGKECFKPKGGEVKVFFSNVTFQRHINHPAFLRSIFWYF